MKELLFKATELNVNVRFSPVSIEEYENWVGMQGKDRWIITILGRRLTARQIANVTAEISEQGMNIDSIQRLTGRRDRHFAAGRHSFPPLPQTDLL